MVKKVVLARILRKFEVRSLDSREGLKMVAEVVLKPSAGIRVCLKTRSC